MSGKAAIQKFAPVPVEANGGDSSGSPFIKVTLADACPREDAEALFEAGLPAFGEFHVEEPGTGYLGKLKLDRNTVTAQLSIFQEASILTWEEVA